MKATAIKGSRVIPAVLVLFFIVGSVAWKTHNYIPADPGNTDTVPEKKTYKKLKDLDRELQQLDQAKASLGKLSDDTWTTVQQQLDAALSKLDEQKMKLEIETAIKDINVEKIRAEVEKSLQKIDFDKIRNEVKASMKEATVEEWKEAEAEILRAREEVKRELSRENWKDLQKDVEKLKKNKWKDVQKELAEARAEIARSKMDLKLNKAEMQQEMDRARQEIDGSITEVKGFQTLIYELAQNGLLNTDKDYTIEYNNGTLIINGEKQSDNVTAQYKKYFRKEKVTIKKKDGEFTFNND